MLIRVILCKIFIFSPPLSPLRYVESQHPTALCTPPRASLPFLSFHPFFYFTWSGKESAPWCLSGKSSHFGVSFFSRLLANCGQQSLNSGILFFNPNPSCSYCPSRQERVWRMNGDARFLFSSFFCDYCSLNWNTHPCRAVLRFVFRLYVLSFLPPDRALHHNALVKPLRPSASLLPFHSWISYHAANNPRTP